MSSPPTYTWLTGNRFKNLAYTCENSFNLGQGGLLCQLGLRGALYWPGGGPPPWLHWVHPLSPWEKWFWQPKCFAAGVLTLLQQLWSCAMALELHNLKSSLLTAHQLTERKQPFEGNVNAPSLAPRLTVTSGLGLMLLPGMLNTPTEQDSKL